jgi:tRNA A-37 threonylcarbamoyl transferase component Bud32
MSAFFERVRQAVAPDYELQRELGGGGMGIVFVAWEPALKRRVAIKVLRPELATAVAAARFRREGETLARAQHPNVVTVHRADERAGLSMLVMELLEGNLADRLRAGALPERVALRAARQLLDGLAHVHRLGIVHRDIKPGNVFFRDDQVVLGDFGISRQTPSEDDGLTDPSQRPGTPAYMAPEQLAARDVGPASDLYAAGAVLYEMLAGRRWAGVGDVRRADWSGVRRPVVRVLQRALAYEADGRWPDAAAFSRALRQAGRSRPLLTSLGVAGSIAVVAGAAIMLDAIFHDDGPAPQYASVAVLPFRAIPADSLAAQTIALAIHDHLEFADPNGAYDVTPMNAALAWSNRHRGADTLPSTAFDELRAERIVWGRLERRDSQYVVVVEVRSRGDTTRTVVDQLLRPGSEVEQSFTLAYQVLGDIEPTLARDFRGSLALRQPFNQAAVDSLMAADREFWRENWSPAERLYRAAIAQDPTMGRAWWGLYNVQRWRRGGIDVDLRQVEALPSAAFRPIDRMLISADLKAGTERLAGYRAAARAYPNQAYPLLLLGNELFHRGALLGIGLDSAVAALRAAEERDPSLAPVLSTMAWALIRQGRDSASRAALDRYADVLSPFGQRDFPFQDMLELAWIARFKPARFDQYFGEFLRSSGGTDTTGQSFRFGMAFGVPDVQVRVMTFLVEHGIGDPADALSGRAVALLALGQVRQALTDLDSAGRLTGSEELALQSAEWRVVLPVLGLPGLEGGRAPGRDALASHASGAGTTAARARWALAIDAFASGDTAAGARWAAALPADSSFEGLRRLAAAFGAAARGDTAEALRLSRIQAQSAAQGALGDPLARAALHLARGRWLKAGDPKAADRAWLWYENSDAHGWPTGPPQSAELDWALETWGRYLRAQLADDTGNRVRSCALLPDVVRRWGDAEPSYASFRSAARALLDRCSPGD